VIDSKTLELRVLSPEWERPLAEFFQVLQANSVSQWFHPHPLSAEEAQKRASYTGKDFYCILVESRLVCGYGMLRGWEEGFTIPSLGIAIHPGFQGQGAGKLLMQFLHLTARVRGAERVRLKFHSNNVRAEPFYRSFGYVIQGEENQQRVGYLDLIRKQEKSVET
jgi:[ribosomal protein S18]-alanine N-acetyltransferase